MRRAIVALVLLLAACGDDDATDESAPRSTTTAPTYEPTVETAPCDDDVPDEPDIACGILTVPVDRAEPDAGDVTIPYAILRSTAPDPLPDPIVYFSGGPGFPGRDIAGFLRELDVGRRRDVIVFDQRGTGASTPSLDCPENVEAVWAALGAADPGLEEAAVGDRALRDCRDRLVADGVDLDAYDTPTTADDVEDLRIALGIDEWNLFGVSYGTTVALEVVRRHPVAVRAAVFDSVFPPDVPVDAVTLVAHAERALDVLVAGCAADAGCAGAHGDVRAGLHALVDAWNAQPFETDVTDPDTGQQRHLVITGDDVVAGVFNAMYDSELIPVLPSLLRPLLERTPLADVVVAELANAGIAQLTGAAEGIAGAVSCADRQRLAGSPSQEVAAAQPFYGSLVLLGDTSDCRLWDVEPVDPSFNELVDSDVPALFLGNEYDPTTPPEDAERAARRFRNGTFVLLPGLGHGAVFAHECPRSLLAAFLDAPTAPVDTSCVGAMGPPAWATG